MIIISMIVSNFCKVSKRNLFEEDIFVFQTVRRITSLEPLNKKPRLIVKIYVRINLSCNLSVTIK